MTTLRLLVTAAVLEAALAAPSSARPNLDAPRPLGTLLVYPDDQRPRLYFYGPGELQVARGSDGKPDIHFLQARYTGNAANGDRGRVVYRSILGFRVSMTPPAAADLQAVRKALAPLSPASVELRALPIQRLDAAVVYAPLGQPAGEGTALPPGHFEADADAPAAGVYWTTRSYVLGLDPETAELFGGALAKGQVVLSVDYTFYTPGPTPSSEPRVVRAGAFAVSVDAAASSDVLRRADVNERVPPGYPLLDVYCYDFGDSRRPALYEKQVEVEAESPGGGRVAAQARFGRDHPDLYARSVRFGVAVRFDRPYRYRVTEVAEDGTSTVTPWRERASWAELLDVTTPADSAPRAADDPGGER
jgi:hypothetical protein